MVSTAGEHGEETFMELSAGEAIPHPQERHQSTGFKGAISSIKETNSSVGRLVRTNFLLVLHTNFPNLSIKKSCENMQETDMKIDRPDLCLAIWCCQVVVLLIC
jgi:hypothetical protein